MNLLMIVLAFVALFGIILMIYIYNFNKLQSYNIRIKQAEGIINESLRNKYDVILKIINIIKSTAKIEQDYFKKIEKIKFKNFSSFDLDRKTTETEILIEDIVNDYSEICEKESFIINKKELKDINNKLNAAKIYYNNNTTELNKLIKKIPSNLVAKINHIKLLTFFDGIDLYDDNISDFKL